MPVTKYRTHEEATQPRSVPGSETNIRRLNFVLAFWSKIRPRQVQHGVFKYRSPEEAQQADRSRR